MKTRRPSIFLVSICVLFVGGVLLLIVGESIAHGTEQTTASPPKQPSAKSSYDWATWSQFWAFKPVVKPVPPTLAGDAKRWVRNPIDAFVLAKLAEKGLKPQAEADKQTLIRRATYDLLGLPPTPQEILAFEADTSADAYEKLIDRLLQSPHYGERWGRHWLDVARYVPGRVTFTGVKNTAGDSHYRDYVIRAFNNDKPYDRFVVEQLAGDLLPAAPARQATLDQIVAPAFLSIGSWFDMETDPNRLRLEMVDEMINTTTKAFMGLSVSCARCHDHKFDPIPIEDYYALGGIFRSTRLVGKLNEFWRDGRQRQLRPLAMPDEVAANNAAKEKVAKVKADRWSLLERRHAELMATWQKDESAYRAAAAKVAAPFALTIEAENFEGIGGLRIAQLRKGDKGTDVLETLSLGAQFTRYRVEVPDTATYRLEALISSDEKTPVELTFNGDTLSTAALTASTGGFDLAFQRWDVVGTGEMRAGVNFIRLTVKSGVFPRLDRLRLIKVDPATSDKVAAVANEQKLNAKLLDRFVCYPNEPWPTVADIESYLPEADIAELKRLDALADKLLAAVKPYPLAVAVTDESQPTDLPVHLRGQTYRTSEAKVTRGLPRFLDAALPRPNVPAGESGRLQLAQWLIDPRHPLTSRVMVNRLWGWHFGRGLVDSPSDFGSRGSTPTHPELLDFLAATFVEQGWSIKQMHRLIMTSSTYRQSGVGKEDSRDREGAEKPTPADVAEAKPLTPPLPHGRGTLIDPEDRYFWRFPTRRLEAEALFDAMLSTADLLPRQTNSPLELAKSSNRAMYVLTTGRSPPGLGTEVRKMLPLFDSQLDGQPIGQRTQSATPAQSLFWLNSPLVKYFAGKFADRLLKDDKLTDVERVEQAYLLALGRKPGAAVTSAAVAFLKQSQDDGDEEQEAWAKLCQAIYGSAEFRYVN